VLRLVQLHRLVYGKVELCCNTFNEWVYLWIPTQSYAAKEVGDIILPEHIKDSSLEHLLILSLELLRHLVAIRNKFQQVLVVFIGTLTLNNLKLSGFDQI
jgi:hypothetical protein